MIHVDVAPVLVLLQRVLWLKLDACGSYVSQQVDSQDLADILKVNTRLHACSFSDHIVAAALVGRGARVFVLFGDENC